LLCGFNSFDLFFIPSNLIFIEIQVETTKRLSEVDGCFGLCEAWKPEGTNGSAHDLATELFKMMTNLSKWNGVLKISDNSTYEPRSQKSKVFI